MPYNLSPNGRKTAEWLKKKYDEGFFQGDFYMIPSIAGLTFLDEAGPTEQQLACPGFVTSTSIHNLVSQGYLFMYDDTYQIPQKLLDMFTEGVTSPAGEFRVAVWTLIDSSYNQDELHQLCFSLSIDPDNLDGRIKREKAHNLVRKMMNERRVVALLDILKKERPHIEWPEFLFT